MSKGGAAKLRQAIRVSIDLIDAYLGPKVPRPERNIMHVIMARNALKMAHDAEDVPDDEGYTIARVRIRPGWHDEGKSGTRAGYEIFVGTMGWTPVVWDDEEDPGWCKTHGLVEVNDG